MGNSKPVIEMKESHPQKNTLLKNADANAASNFFKRVFFLPPKKNFSSPIFLFFFRHRTGAVRDWTDSASIVNRFVDSVCLNLNDTPSDRQQTSR